MSERFAQTIERPDTGRQSRCSDQIGQTVNSTNLFDLQQLVRRCMGRIELAERLLKSFESRFPEDLSKIESCLAEDDSQQASRLVHQMKGAAANISAPELYAILARMEQAVRTEQHAAAQQCLDEIHEAWDRHVEFKSSIEQR